MVKERNALPEACVANALVRHLWYNGICRSRKSKVQFLVNLQARKRGYVMAKSIFTCFQVLKLTMNKWLQWDGSLDIDLSNVCT